MGHRRLIVTCLLDHCGDNKSCLHHLLKSCFDSIFSSNCKLGGRIAWRNDYIFRNTIVDLRRKLRRDLCGRATLRPQQLVDNVRANR